MKVVNKSKSKKSGFSGSKTMGISNTAKMQEIFATKIYSHPLRTAIQEYFSNAVDSHNEAKVCLSKIEVTSPTLLNQNVIIKDYGLGMSSEDIKIYFDYCSSSKDNDNNSIGGFGIGAKSWFSVNDSFTVTSVKNKLKSSYIITKTDAPDSFSEIILIYVDKKTDEPNCTELSLPLKSEDQIDESQEAIKRVCKHIPVLPNVTNLNIDKKDLFLYDEEDFSIKGDYRQPYTRLSFKITVCGTNTNLDEKLLKRVEDEFYYASKSVKINFGASELELEGDGFYKKVLNSEVNFVKICKEIKKIKNLKKLYFGHRTTTITVGNIQYDISNKIQSLISDTIGRTRGELNLKFKVSEITVAPSRESIVEDKRNLNNIKSKALKVSRRLDELEEEERKKIKNIYQYNRIADALGRNKERIKFSKDFVISTRNGRIFKPDGINEKSESFSQNSKTELVVNKKYSSAQNNVEGIKYIDRLYINDIPFKEKKIENLKGTELKLYKKEFNKYYANIKYSISLDAFNNTSGGKRAENVGFYIIKDKFFSKDEISSLENLIKIKKISDIFKEKPKPVRKAIDPSERVSYTGIPCTNIKNQRDVRIQESSLKNLFLISKGSFKIDHDLKYIDFSKNIKIVSEKNILRLKKKHRINEFESNEDIVSEYLKDVNDSSIEFKAINAAFKDAVLKECGYSYPSSDHIEEIKKFYEVSELKDYLEIYKFLSAKDYSSLDELNSKRKKGEQIKSIRLSYKYLSSMNPNFEKKFNSYKEHYKKMFEEFYKVQNKIILFNPLIKHYELGKHNPLTKLDKKRNNEIKEFLSPKIKKLLKKV